MIDRNFAKIHSKTEASQSTSLENVLPQPIQKIDTALSPRDIISSHRPHFSGQTFIKPSSDIKDYLNKLSNERCHVANLIMKTRKPSFFPAVLYPKSLRALDDMLAKSIIKDKYGTTLHRLTADLSNEERERFERIAFEEGRTDIDQLLSEKINHQESLRRKIRSEQLPVRYIDGIRNIASSERIDDGVLLDAGMRTDGPFKIMVSSRDMPNAILENLASDSDLHNYIKGYRSALPEVPMEESGEYPKMLLDVRQDTHLEEFFNGDKCKKIAEIFPFGSATPEDESTFLGHLIDLNHTVFAKNMREPSAFESHTTNLFLSNPLQEGVDSFLFPEEYGVSSVQKIGHAIRDQEGVCRHHAMLSKMILDRIPNSGAEISVKQGLLRNDPTEKDIEKMQKHVWNTITFKSGRKYFFDSLNQSVYCISQRVNGHNVKVDSHSNQAELDYHQSLYLKFTHALKSAEYNYVS